MNKSDFNPLSWSILFFSLWYTIKTLHNDSYNLFAWFLFGMSIILLGSIYWDWLYKILNSPRSVQMILPTIFILTIASSIFGVLLALKDLSNLEQLVASILLLLLLGTCIAILISTFKKLIFRIVGCILIIILSIIRFIYFGFDGSWPMILMVILSVWATIAPGKFSRIPLV